METAAYWINKLELQPHPEGGYYREVFKSENSVVRHGSSELRSAVTSIYYLLEGDDFSGFHKIASDELWYFHKGVPLHIHVMEQDGSHSVHELSAADTGSLSFAVKAGLWFASELPTKKDFALVSCAVAPGFEFAEFEMGCKAALIKQFIGNDALFERLCRC